MVKKRPLFLFILIIIGSFVLACGSTGDDTPTLPADDLSAPGPFTKCTYQDDALDSTEYSSAIVVYPCETSSGPFAATTLTGGWTNSKEDMYWLADQVVTYGYVIIAMTPNNQFNMVTTEWSRAHKAGVDMLLAESSRAGSPIYGLVDPERLSIMGFSMGGGGSLRASNEVGDKVKTTLALAPWESEYTDDMYANISAATVCFTGTADTIAPSSDVKKMFEHLPIDVTRAYIDFQGAGHMDWMGSTGDPDYQMKFETLVIAWLKAFVDGDASYATYFEGEKHQQEADAGWFNEYIYL